MRLISHQQRLLEMEKIQTFRKIMEFKDITVV
jgi:hypothetical protein